jgi:dTDP-4-amino-4,6-dideoxygalactose transaminase
MEYKVPFVAYKKQSQIYGKGIIKEIQRVMDGGDYILRKDVSDFEEELAKRVGVKYAIGVNSGTDAMLLVLKVLGLRRGAEVIVPAHTFVATLGVIVEAGLKPILIDTGKDFNMDTSKIEDFITNNTVAMMPVHLNGRCCNMRQIISIAQRYNLYVIEDAAQALGAKFEDKYAGSWGIASAFSFFPAKILGTIGDAGAVTTNDIVLARKIKELRDHGRIIGQEQLSGYGCNSRLDNVHAAILNYKIQFLPEWIKRRRAIAWMYHKYLSMVLSDACMSPIDGGDYFDVYQNFVIRTHGRDSLVKHLTESGIETIVSWRTPLNKQKALRLDKFKLPMTEMMCDELISLPMYPELTDGQVKYVCDKIMIWMQKKGEESKAYIH